MAAKIASRIRLRRNKLLYSQIRLVNYNLAPEDEYTDAPKYPPIFDTSYEATKRRQRQEWYDRLRSLPTVEQKLREICVEQGKQFSYIITPYSNCYNNLPAFQYATRTHLIKGLPESYNIDVEDVYARLKSHLIDAIAFEMDINRSAHLKPEVLEASKQTNIISQIVSTLLKGLVWQFHHLEAAEVDREPRCDAFWWHARYIPDMKRWNRDKEFMTMPFQYSDHPDIQIRINEPLPPVVSREDPLVQCTDVPDFPYHPRGLRMVFKKRYLTSLPGKWPTSKCNFPLLTLRRRIRVVNEKSVFKTPEDIDKGLDASAVLVGFGTLNAFATTLGFTPFNDVTYPLVSQDISTDGKYWTFSVYQLNTNGLHPDFYHDNPSRNLCWTSGSLRLFEQYEDGELKGLDDEVFKTLLRFFVNKPVAPEGVELTPYLGEDNRTEEEKEEARKQWHRLYDNRFNLMEAIKNEVPLWVKIYKKHPEAPPCPTIKLK